MVLGNKMALVLRAKGGDNFMVQTRGIAGKTVQDAVAEVLEALAKYSGAGGRAGDDGSGDAAPGFALGSLAALQGRYLVTYRMVNAVLVLLVTDPAANAFLCLRALDAVAKVLVGACKGVDVSADRVGRRYLEVHTALGDLLSGGLDELPPAFVHASATDERVVGVPLSTADAARRLRRLVASGSKTGSSFVPDKAAEGGDPTPLPKPETPTQRGGRQFALETADPLGGVEFHIPYDALPPPPARAAGARRHSTVPPPRAPPAPPPAFEGAVQEGAAKGAPPEAEGFGAFGSLERLEAQPAAAAVGAEAPAVTADDEWGAEFDDAAAVAPAAKEPADDDYSDVKAALQLVEIYRGHVEGGELKTGGVKGAVRRRLAPFGLQAARFRLLPAPRFVVNACLGVATLDPGHTQQLEAASEESPGFVARLAGAPMDCCYVQYTLPGIVCNPPLQLELVAAPQAARPFRPGQPKGPWQAFVMLRYACDPKLGGSLLDVVADVDLPPELVAVARASPAPFWSPQQCRLRWELGTVDPGASGTLRAVLNARDDVEPAQAESALAAGAVAKVVFTGRPGRALSGVGFEVGRAGGGGGEAEAEAKYVAGLVLWFGEITARP